MALDTEIPFARFSVMLPLVEMVLGSVVVFCTMALVAEFVFLLVTLKAVNVMAIAAANAAMIHLALHERPVDVDFFKDLAVRIIEPFPEYLRYHHIQ
jgi:hypothetical protein